jgi:hypothetical protein
MSIDITDAKLSRLFGHSGGWAQGMITRHLHEITSANPVARGRPRLVESEGEKSLIQFCLKRQAEKRPCTDSSLTVDLDKLTIAPEQPCETRLMRITFPDTVDRDSTQEPHFHHSGRSYFGN